MPSHLWDVTGDKWKAEFDLCKFFPATEIHQLCVPLFKVIERFFMFLSQSLTFSLLASLILLYIPYHTFASHNYLSSLQMS